MAGNNSDRAVQGGGRQAGGSGIPVGLLIVLVIGVLAALGIGTRYYVHGDLNAIHCLFSVFFSTNLLICYWELCLFFRRDYVETRAEHWRGWQRETGRTPAVEFLTTRVPLSRTLSPTVWADAWATYSMIDSAYEDRGTFGFNVDIGNGFVTPLPTMVLCATYTVGFLPAIVAGIIGAMLFWQWVFASSLYWVSFFMARKHTRITRGELYAYVVGPNAIWVFIDGRQIDAEPVSNSVQLAEKVRSDTQVVAIDEAQFLDDGICEVVDALADGGMRVIMAGTDMDFRGEPFGPMGLLLARAERIDKLNAICVVCGDPATRNQRLIDGKPAPAEGPTIHVGGAETYEARCRRCHEVPKRDRAQRELVLRRAKEGWEGV